MHRRIVVALAVIALLITASPPASAAPLAPPVECWIENHNPSVAAGTWASYTVHISGGYGTFSITLSYGDGTQEQRTSSSSATGFSHVFSVPGTYTQTATVSGAGSSDVCTATTSVY